MNDSTDFNAADDRTGDSQRLRGVAAIDTSGRSGSISWHVPGQSPLLIRLDPAHRSAVTLTPALAEIVTQSRHAGVPIDCVAVNVGPGSFTGIRIGVTTAKTLAYALRCRLIAVDSLAVAAGKVFAENSTIETVYVALNAYRQQFFVAKWERKSWGNAFFDNSHAACDEVWPVDRWHHLSSVNTDPSVRFAAEPAVIRSLNDASNDAESTAPDSESRSIPIQTIEINAQDVGEFALRLAVHGHFLPPMNCNPNYLRDSAAEEKLR